MTEAKTDKTDKPKTLNIEFTATVEVSGRIVITDSTTMGMLDKLLRATVEDLLESRPRFGTLVNFRPYKVTEVPEELVEITRVLREV